ncbi:cell surface protein [Bifidobacterium ramosum]|uniref:Cell surface protein n=1 Tax=Bifidobacterium ramosum TaxID=1798158 RepID=A0A6L4WZZ0_9BIFI|nr:isopeptide-forming domain-containing fimbrial protein [Bifidobacterium ramosum]KAB8287596.1 cell surface protein [Bifidobacterium ramosum]NEG72372.1 isopeptide-forming domain-containing fimbrial protein [Bifidobacterium ramosum]
MNSLTKKLAAGAIAAATMLGIAGLGATTASADTTTPTGSLTVTTTDSSFASKTVNAYQMFSATVDLKGTAEYTLVDTWNEFFTTELKTAGSDDGVCKDKTGTELTTCAVDYVSKLSDSEGNDSTVEGYSRTLTSFATKASNWAQKTKTGDTTPNVTVAKTANVSDTASDGTYTASFTGLDFGYYLLAVPGVAQNDANFKYATLVSVTTATGNTAVIKGSYPTVDKKVDGADEGTAKIGDELTFTLTSTVPDMSAYDTYQFAFKDILSKGLTFNDQTGLESIKILNDDNTVAATLTTDNYSLSYEAGDGTNGATTDEHKLTVKLGTNSNGKYDFKAYAEQYTGKKIVLTYKATLNEKAEIEGTGTQNKATVEFSNNPQSDGTGESVPDIVKVYTYKFGIDKYTTENGKRTQLPGAKFTLTPKDEQTAIQFVVEEQGNSNKATTYRVAKTDEQGATAEIVTPDSGKVMLKGLKAGEYVLTETEAPKGYSKLTKPMGVKITEKDGDKGGKTGEITYNNNSASDAYGLTATDGYVAVENNKAPILPSTGGMGTALFTVFGVLIVALGAGWYVKSNRKSAK